MLISMLRRRVLPLAAMLCLPATAALAAAADISCDVAIYGGTSGGVVAAVQAARMGKNVVLIEPGRHLGGMTSGGLSAVDIGDPRTIGGITREFFTRLVARYGKKLAWDEPHKAVGGSGGGTGGAYAIEPHVAEEVFEELVKEAAVTVLRDARLIEVTKEGPRISRIVVTGPGDTRREIAAKIFIDTTYEGDLMAAAGVSHTLTREGRDQYDESLAGIRYADWCRPRAPHEQPGPNGRKPGGQGVWDRDFPLDPYVRKGDPSSGLLPLINPGEPGTPGEAAPGVQAYCFRLCLTTAADRLPIEPPPGYDPARYEIVARFIEACVANGDDMDLRWFSKHDPVPNEKYDFNTATFGGNLPGASWGWCEASPERRQELFREHEHHQRGLLHFLATDPRVPAKVRADMRRFGLPRDEFRDTGGWPHQLYVREGRRMIGDVVMTQHHACGKQVAADPVSLGSYGIDAHEIRRIVKDGVVTREGKLAEGREGAGPYGISYRSIVPKQAECDNLLVTFALSASHVAFSSIRMEPVFMVSSQTAATAAAMAIDAGVPVQAVDYSKLKPRLVADGQILGMPAPPPKAPKNAAKPEDVNGKSYDLVVIGGTPGGIACAVRAAREGLRVLLVNHTRHLGGFITSGAGGWEATYDGHRSPLYGEMLAGAAAYYRDRYGDGSPQHVLSMPSTTSRAHIDRAKVEPRVAELLFNRMIEREQSLTVLFGHVVGRAECEGKILKRVTLRPMHGEGTVAVSGTVFADAMYEGDLMAAAGVKTQIGRESREKYGEQHAGVIYTKELSREPGQRGFPKVADNGTLNIRYIGHSTGEIVAGPHSGEADDSVMAYNYRLILTRDPANRIMVEKPANYDPAIAKAAAGGGFVPNLPNGKVAWNGGRLIGPQNDYPAADWPAREAIAKRYLDAMLMRLWWLQNDPEAPAGEREAFAGYGLAADEFRDNHNVPYEIYVREARRLVGRHVFKEQDNLVAEGIARTPVHADSIAITDWPMDSVACLPRSVPGGNVDGILFLAEQSRPAQVPYRSILTHEVDNLLVPVAISASHVGWGSIRLEPIWMQLGESAGHAAALSVKSATTPARLDPDHLVRKLAASRVMVTFFNDVDVASNDPRVAAAQYFGTKGFFAGYDARLDEPLTEAVRGAWLDGFEKLKQVTLDAAKLAAAVQAAESQDSPATEELRGEALQRLFAQLEVPATQTTALEKIDVFEAKTGGYMLYRIPGIVVTAKGTVLAYCEARKSASGDWGTIDILLRRSTDGGRTWGEPHSLADVPGPKQKNPVALKQKLATNDEVTYNNCTLFADRAGPVHALFCLEYARCFYLRSDDDGRTWSKPVEITKAFEAFRSEFDWKVLATGPAHGIQLRSGRLVVPVWLSTGTGGHAHRPSVTATIYSDDSGSTWHRGDIAVPSTPEWIDPNEAVVVELADGRVMLNVRSWSKQHRRLVTTSPDGATGWKKPKFDDALLEPICMASIVRHSLAGEAGGRNRILFANPHWLERADGKAQPGFGRDRKNVSVKLSYDEGQTWPVSKSLEAGFSGYSDLAVLPDGTILCFYERGSIDGKNNFATGRLTVARFNLAWLTDGADR
jgi:flavin-dependent dehydrogenase